MFVLHVTNKLANNLLLFFLFCFSFKVDGKKVHLNTSNIKYFLELNQVGLVQDDPQLWAHSDPVSRTKTTFTNDKVPYQQKKYF